MDFLGREEGRKNKKHRPTCVGWQWNNATVWQDVVSQGPGGISEVQNEKMRPPKKKPFLGGPVDWFCFGGKQVPLLWVGKPLA